MARALAHQDRCPLLKKVKETVEKKLEKAVMDASYYSKDLEKAKRWKPIAM
jgi:hypothetical protein